VYEVGMTGIPIFNVNNNCSTGSTALMLAKEFVESGKHDCVLALGFEKMERGSLSAKVIPHEIYLFWSQQCICSFLTVLIP
jgi:sterol carrier protein 2